MTSDRRTWLAQGLAGLLATTALPRAGAQSAAGKPIRLLVGYPPGGPNDILARLIAPRLGEALKQAVIVENRPGVAGNLASTEVARAAGDGQTLLLGSAGPNAISPAVYPNFPFDPVKDIAPISMVALVPNVLVVRPDLPAQSLAELVALVRSKPGKLTFASSGSGSTLHLSGELFKQQAGLYMLHIPYRGTAPSVTDLIAGQVDATFTGAPAVLPHVKSGRLRALAVSSPARLPNLPDVPTVAESGFTGFEADQWYGVVAPAGTPAAVVARLNAEINKALSLPEVAQQLAVEGATPMPGTPKAFGDLIARELPRWAEVVKAGNVKPD